MKGSLACASIIKSRGLSDLFYVLEWHTSPLALPFSVLLFEGAAIFGAAAEDVGDFRYEAGKHCLKQQTTLRQAVARATNTEHVML